MNFDQIFEVEFLNLLQVSKISPPQRHNTKTGGICPQLLWWRPPAWTPLGLRPRPQNMCPLSEFLGPPIAHTHATGLPLRREEA